MSDEVRPQLAQDIAESSSDNHVCIPDHSNDFYNVYDHVAYGSEQVPADWNNDPDDWVEVGYFWGDPGQSDAVNMAFNTKERGLDGLAMSSDNARLVAYRLLAAADILDRYKDSK